MTLAGVLTLVWAVLVTLPLATHSSDEDRRREKLESIKASPVYEFLTVS